MTLAFLVPNNVFSVLFCFPFSVFCYFTPVFYASLLLARFLCIVVYLPFSVLGSFSPIFCVAVTPIFSVFCCFPFFVPLFFSRFLFRCFSPVFCVPLFLSCFLFRCFSPVFYTNVFCVVLLTFSFRSSLTFRMELHVKLGQFLLCFDCLSVSSSPLFSPSLPYQPSLHFLSLLIHPFHLDSATQGSKRAA